MENLPLDPLNEICQYLNRVDLFQLLCCNNTYRTLFTQRLRTTRPLGSYKTLKYLFKFYAPDFVLDSLMRVVGCKMVKYNIPWIVYNLSIEKSREISERVCISFSDNRTNDAVIQFLREGGVKIDKYSDNLIHQCVKERNFRFITLIKEKYPHIFKDGVYESYLVKYGFWTLLPTISSFHKWRKYKTESPLYYLAKFDNWQDLQELLFFESLDSSDIISGLIKYKKYEDIIKFANLWFPEEILEKSIQSGDVNMIKILEEIIPTDLIVRASYKVIPNIQWLKYLIKKKVPWKPFRNGKNKLTNHQIAMKNIFKEYFHDLSWYES